MEKRTIQIKLDTVSESCFSNMHFKWRETVTTLEEKINFWMYYSLLQPTMWIFSCVQVQASLVNVKYCADNLQHGLMLLGHITNVGPKKNFKCHLRWLHSLELQTLPTPFKGHGFSHALCKINTSVRWQLKTTKKGKELCCKLPVLLLF